MTRLRLAAAAAISIASLLVAASIGEAQRDDRYRSQTGCKTKHTMTRDFAKLKTEVSQITRPGPTRRAGAAAVVPADGVKVITKLIDMTPENGNNVVAPAKIKKTTNDNGIARARHEFNNFGNYKFTVKVKVDGEVVATDERTFGVSDRVDGPCGPPLGAGEA